MQSALLSWFDQSGHGRKNLPWQQPATPYRVWVSEIMLQQTQVSTVINYFQRFITALPNVEQLAQADQDTILHLWTGLGYYARARNLHKSAKIICTQYGGKLPKSIEALTSLPGIGRSTAGAILSIAMQKPTAILDGNVKRILCRLHTIEGWSGHTKTLNRLWELAEHYTPDTPERIADYTQAIMDLGATTCIRTQPRCNQCPLINICAAYKTKQITRFPYRHPPKTLPLRKTTLLMLCNDKDELLLKKRPPTGIWGGLWSFPECDIDTEKEINDCCKTHYGLIPTDIYRWEMLHHTFSHFRLAIYPIFIRVRVPETTFSVMETTDKHLWYNVNQPDSCGLAAPIKALLEKHKSNLLDCLR